MGNAAPSSPSTPAGDGFDKVTGDPNFNANCVDPRSPSDGIIRTPIVMVNSPGDFASKRPCLPVPFDTSDFESIDGVETEDDSLHRNVDTSALSDTVAAGTSNRKAEGH
ncbi:unnamed protein product [Dibothriocephalus latus]|uniref:Uncharacterized protein n=1 Tax=Dibothriocephalus latus TaxID=60516 RepID=A0A3P7MW38_DIBLA|nr:unnamed protein product [Dibothriocephalus latus]